MAYRPEIGHIIRQTIQSLAKRADLLRCRARDPVEDDDVRDQPNLPADGDDALPVIR